MATVNNPNARLGTEGGRSAGAARTVRQAVRRTARVAQFSSKRELNETTSKWELAHKERFPKGDS